MFSAFADGDPDALLEAVCDALGEQARRRVAALPRLPRRPAEQRHAFRGWLREHRIPATAVFGAYPEATVDACARRWPSASASAPSPSTSSRRRGAQSAFAAFAREGRP